MPEVMFFAELGGGVYRNGERLAVAAPSEPLVGALHGRWGRPRPEESRNVELVRLAGCCGVDYPRLIEGECDYVLYGRSNAWDHAPGTLMVAEAGGRFGHPDGSAYTPRSTGPGLVVAADPRTYAVVQRRAHLAFPPRS